jgi:hypothetical protein
LRRVLHEPVGSFAKTSPAWVDDANALATAKERQESVIATLIDNLQRLRDGRPLLALIDKQKGY